MTAATPPAENGEGPAEKDLAKALDLALYPGATVVKNKTASDEKQKRYHVTLETKDTPKQVADFYQKQGIPGAVKDDKAQAMGPTKHGNLVIINADRKGDKTEISIAVSSGTNHG
jgi:hypothetical protein